MENEIVAPSHGVAGFDVQGKWEGSIEVHVIFRVCWFFTGG
jgi:hypothetical protein